MGPSNFIISLDFELYWGSFDTKQFDHYKKNVEGARHAIPKILDLFKKYEIHATWATVGYLFYDQKSELLKDLPKIQPQYKNQKRNSYLHLKDIGESEKDDPYHFARSIVQKIQSTEGQEIATHTFSHYYCLEPGQTLREFHEDIKAAKRAASHLGIQIKSLVFPRNQFNEAYLEICAKEGITSIRGTESSWIYKARNRKKENFMHRGLRLIDTYFKITPNHSYQPNKGKKPINLAASRFLRPVSNKLRPFEPIRLAKIKNELKQAASTGMTYHLWWHPHNFGDNTEGNLAFLEEILKCYQEQKETHGIQSKTMSEVSESLNL